MALLLVYALISATSPMNGEDYGLAMPLDAAQTHSTIGWILERSSQQIVGWNARLGEQLAILWLAAGKPAFVVANTLCFAAFASLVAWYGAGSVALGRPFLFDWAFAAALGLLAWPRLEMFFWETAAAGYLQPLVLTLIVLAPFFFPEVRARLSASRVAAAAFATAAVLAGASFENVGPAVALTMAGAAVLARRHDRSGARRLALVAAGYTLGWLALMLAPSTAIRVHSYRDTFHIEPLSLEYLARRSLDMMRVLAGTTGWLVVLVAAAVALALSLRASLRETVPARHAGLALAALPSVLAVAFAPYTEPRSFAWLWVVLLVVACRAHHVARQRRPRFMEPLTAALLVGALAFGGTLHGVYASFAERVGARERRILAARGTEACEAGLSIALIPTSASTRLLRNREKWLAQFPAQVSRYYGCRLVVE